MQPTSPMVQSWVPTLGAVAPGRIVWAGVRRLRSQPPQWHSHEFPAPGVVAPGPIYGTGFIQVSQGLNQFGIQVTNYELPSMGPCGHLASCGGHMDPLHLVQDRVGWPGLTGRLHWYRPLVLNLAHWVHLADFLKCIQLLFEFINSTICHVSN